MCTNFKASIIQRRQKQFKKFYTKILCKNPWQRTKEYNIDFKIFLLILQFKKIFPISKMIATLLDWLFFRSLFWVTLVAVQQTFSKSSSSGKKLELYIHEKQEAMAIINCNVGREGPVFHPWSSITVNLVLACVNRSTTMADSNLPRPAKTALAADDTSDTTIKKRRLRCLESRRLKMELKRRHIESLQHELTQRTTTSYDTNTLPALSTSSVIESTPESSPSSSSIVVSLPKSARQSARKMAKDPAAATQVIFPWNQIHFRFLLAD